MEAAAGSRRSALLVTDPTPQAPTWQLTHLWAPSHDLRERERKKSWLLVALDDFDFSPVVSEFHHITENITHPIQEIIEFVDAVLQKILFLFRMNIIPFPFPLSYETLHGLVDWKPKRKSHQHIWCYSFNYRQ